jgi:steroid 5-alpha reductase family enzyme
MAMGQTSNPAHGWLLWLAPFALLFLILKVTGIPPTEAQALRSRGDAYRAYQSETNAFFPGPRSHTSPTRTQ